MLNLAKLSFFETPCFVVCYKIFSDDAPCPFFQVASTCCHYCFRRLCSILPGVVFLLCFVALLLTIYMTSAYKWNCVVLVVVFCALLCHSLCSSPCVVGTTFLPPGAWCSECKTQSLQSPLR